MLSWLVYIYHTNQVDVGRYTIHLSYGIAWGLGESVHNMTEVFWFIGIVRCLVQAIVKRNLEHRIPKWVQLPHDFERRYTFQPKITSLNDVIGRLRGATGYIYISPTWKDPSNPINASTFKYTNRDLMRTTIPIAHKSGCESRIRCEEGLWNLRP